MGTKKRLPEEVQAMVDGGLNLFHIVVAIMATVCKLATKLGRSDKERTEAIHRLSRPESANTVRAIAELILGKTATVVQRTWQDLFTACQQYWHNSDFTEEKWPLEPIAPDESEWEVKEHFFDDNATGEEKLRRLAEMEERGEIRTCGVRRAMEDTADHLDIQLDHPRIISVSAQGSVGDLCLPSFSCRWDGGRQRELYLCDVSGEFSSRCGWLVLSKRP